MQYRNLEIGSRPRRNLTRVRDPDAVLAISVSGSGLQSLAGVEAMRNLAFVNLANAGALDLGPLRGLTRITQVHVERAAGLSGLSVLETLPALEMISLDLTTREQAAGVASVEFTAIPRLKYLDVVNHADPVPIDLRWLECSTLEKVTFFGFAVGDDQLDAIAATRVRRFFFTASSAAQAQRLQELTADRHPDDFQISPPAGTLDPIEVYEEDDGRWTMQADLVDLLSVETNHAAERRLIRELRRTDPDTARRIDFDSEADWIFASGTHDDIRTLERLARSLAGQ